MMKNGLLSVFAEISGGGTSTRRAITILAQSRKALLPCETDNKSMHSFFAFHADGGSPSITESWLFIRWKAFQL
jgi:hypothetical protein